MTTTVHNTQLTVSDSVLLLDKDLYLMLYTTL